MNMNVRYTKGVLKGSGSYKSVYEGYDNLEKRIVAYNEVSLLGLDPQKKERIFGEVQLLKQLNHKRVLPIYDAWVTETHLRFTTEMMSCSLSDHIRRMASIKITDLKRWAEQILSGLEYLHSMKILHRDLKCDNIFYDNTTSSVKIGDFGLSISVRDKRFAVSLLGTPNYLAPECFEEEYDEKIDIWAFGMCILELFTGEYPYSEFSSPLHIIRAIMYGKKPQALQTVTTPLCKDLIETCLRPRNRRPTAKELLNHPFFLPNPEHDCLVIRYPGISSHLFSVRSLESEVSIPRVSSTTQGHVEKKKLAKKEKSTIAVVESLNTHTALIAVYICINNQYKKIRISYDRNSDSIDQIASDLQNYFNLSDKVKDSIVLAMVEALSDAVDNESDVVNENNDEGKDTELSENSSTSPSSSEQSELSEDSNSENTDDLRKNIQENYTTGSEKSKILGPPILYIRNLGNENVLRSPKDLNGNTLMKAPMSKITFLEKLRQLDHELEIKLENIERKIQTLKVEKKQCRQHYSMERSKLLEEFACLSYINDYIPVYTTQKPTENILTPVLSIPSNTSNLNDTNSPSPSNWNSSTGSLPHKTDSIETASDNTPNNLDTLFSDIYFPQPTYQKAVSSPLTHFSTDHIFPKLSFNPNYPHMGNSMYMGNNTPVSDFGVLGVENSKQKPSEEKDLLVDVFDSDQDMQLELPALQPQKKSREIIEDKAYS